MRTTLFAASHMLAALGVAMLALSSPTEAHEKKAGQPPAASPANHDTDHATVSISGAPHSAIRADSHAPIGVMGDHMHHAGEWMVSYRYMAMLMRGNLDGDSQISAETIATTVPNRFFGQPGQPPTLRVVPTDMEMQMHMFGAMYAPTDDLTLMVMGNYVEKSMGHITFAGGAGATRLAKFDVNTSGLGDTSVAGLVRLFDDDMHHLHLNLGLSIPTGSIEEEAAIVAPNNARPVLRVPYAMQLGTGTFDLMPGITYTGTDGDLGWGGQLAARIHPYRNSQGYAYGDRLRLDVWASRQWAPWASTSLRIGAQSEGQIEGIDNRIAVPNQTADPDNYGGERLDVSLGVNLVAQRGDLRGLRLAMEATVPVYQNLNGPQMDTDLILTLGLQYAW
ncbi:MULTISPECIES: transporter [unclassified Minwuia]|uniref:transporter n=1 Tax=unclassified Minwuia TaxID=2618799 RepID=UPI00247A0CB5|nr:MULTISPECIES: transporter [unclassified Minwuia]